MNFPEIGPAHAPEIEISRRFLDEFSRICLLGLNHVIKDAFDCDSGKATSPLELNSQSLHENQLIPGLVQDLQSLRLKLDTSVKRNEMLSEKYLEKLEVEATKGTSKGSKVETREFATNTDLTVSIYPHF